MIKQVLALIIFVVALVGSLVEQLQIQAGIRKLNLIFGITTGKDRLEHHHKLMKPFGIISIKTINHDERFLLLLLSFLQEDIKG